MLVLRLSKTVYESRRIQIWPLLSKASVSALEGHRLAGRLFPRNRRLEPDHFRHKEPTALLAKTCPCLRTRPFWAFLTCEQKIPSSLTGRFFATWQGLLSHFRVETAIVGSLTCGGRV